MSTNAFIYLKLKPGDQGVKLNVNQERFNDSRPNIGNGFDYKCFGDVVTSENLPYIRIYCHHDGYLKGVGRDLEHNFNTYEKVLALILTGDTSGFSGDGNLTEAYSRYEGFGCNEPEQFRSIPLKDSSYAFSYLFDGEQWLVGYEGDFITLEERMKIYETV